MAKYRNIPVRRWEYWVVFALLWVAAAGCVPAALAAAPTGAAPQPPATATPVPGPPGPSRPIYVVDPNDQGILSNIFMIDPDAARVVWTLQTRFLPEAALSPDGRRLLVAETYRTQVTRGEQRDVLSVYDALSGQLLQDDLPIPGRLLYKAWPVLSQPFVFFSSDGGTLFIEQYGAPDVHQLRLLSLNGDSLKTIEQGLRPGCIRRILAASDRWVCLDGANLVEFRPREPGSQAKSLLALPGERIIATARHPAGEQVTLLDAAGGLTVVDLRQNQVVSRRSLTYGSGLLPAPQMALSADGSRLYVALSKEENRDSGFFDAVAVFGATDGSQAGLVSFPDRVIHFAVSAAGDQLYAISPDTQTLRIFDLHTFQQRAVIEHVGGSPAQILVSP